MRKFLAALVAATVVGTIVGAGSMGLAVIVAAIVNVGFHEGWPLRTVAIVGAVPGACAFLFVLVGVLLCERIKV